MKYSVGDNSESLTFSGLQRKLAQRAAVILGCWTLYGLFGVSHSYLARVNAGRGNMTPAVLYDFFDAYIWALLTPLLIGIAERLPIERPHVVRNTVAMLAIGLAFAGVSVIIIGATIRMAVLSRAKEISIMRLVGATDAYIRRPFLIEGIAKGEVQTPRLPRGCDNVAG